MPRNTTPKQTLASKAVERKVTKSKPVFADSPDVPRVPLSDGRVGCVQNQLTLAADGKTVERGADMLTIPRTNADGTESGLRFPLAEIQLIADGFRAVGIQLV